MKTLHLYLLRQAVSTLIMTVCVFGFVLLLGNVLKEILALLVNRQATLGLVAKAILLLLPWIMAYVLPFALLTGMLLLFGRLSADNELTAVKGSGISLLSLITPLLLFGLVMSGVCAWFNLKITPETRVAYKRVLLEPLIKSSEMLITEDRFIDEIPGIVLYVREKHGDELQDVLLYELDKDTGLITRRTTAKRGRILWDHAREALSLHLEDALIQAVFWREQDVREPSAALPFTNLLSTNSLQLLTTNPAPGRAFGKTRIPEWNQGHGSTNDIGPFELSKIVAPEREPRLTEMTFRQLGGELRKRRDQGITITPVLVQMHRQVAFSFASFVFTLVAIPLGIRAHRRETSIGMAISLGLVVIYYGFLILSEALQTREHLHPHLIVWIPNLLFQTLGSILLWRANRMG